LFLDNYTVLGGRTGIAVGLLFSLVIIVPTLYLLVRRRSGREQPHGLGSTIVVTFFITSLLCYLVLPRDLPGQTILYQRFSALVLLSVIVLGARMGRNARNRFAVPLVILLCIGHFALWAEHFISFNRENSGFTGDFLRGVRSGGTLAGIVFDYRYRGNPAYIHFPNYYIVWRRGIACTKLVDYRFGIVRRRADGESLPRYDEWAGRFDSYDGRYRNLGYLLVRGAPTERALRRLERFRSIYASGKWTLYENAGGDSGTTRPPGESYGAGAAR
jgi:hypothetical protein